MFFVSCTTVADAQDRSASGAAAPHRIDLTPVAPPKALEDWRASMERAFKPWMPAEGCFQATYPSVQWVAVPCVAAPPGPVHKAGRPFGKSGPAQKQYVEKFDIASSSSMQPETVGNGVDYMAQVTGANLLSATGSFDSVSGVTAENDGGTANDFSLQLNSNFFDTAVCNGLPTNGNACLGWEQFLFTPEYTNSTTEYVYIQYWLLNVTACPGGWILAGGAAGGCYRNSASVPVPSSVNAIANLANLTLNGSIANGNDTVTLASGTTIYKLTANDNVVNLANGWNTAEFNIFGAGNSTQATLNNGSTLVVRTTVDNGTFAAPACLNGGTTAETSNLTLGNQCCSFSGQAANANGSATLPSIAFVESNATPAPATNCAALAPVCNFTLSASPATLTIPVGSSAVSNVTVNGSCPVIFAGEGNIPNQVVYLGATGASTSTTVTVDILGGTAPGTYTFDVNGTHSLGTSSQTTATVPITVVVTAPRLAAKYDFDGDGKADFPIFRQSSGQWFLDETTAGINNSVFGVAGEHDIPVPGDYDGDGRVDRAYWNPATGTFNVALSSNGTTVSRQWGSSADGDIPVPGDYDGDGKTDYAVYRQSTGQWFIILSSTGAAWNTVFGVGGEKDVPVPGDFDGDGKTDLAYWNPSSGTWNVRLSSTGAAAAPRQWGSSAVGDVPVSGDYDGDGKADYAVFRQSTGQWFIILSGTGSAWNSVFGVSGQNDIPLQGDFDGDGKSDLAYWNPASGTWNVRYSSTGSAMTPLSWGAQSLVDIPASAPSAYIRSHY